MFFFIVFKSLSLVYLLFMSVRMNGEVPKISNSMAFYDWFKVTLMPFNQNVLRRNIDIMSTSTLPNLIMSILLLLLSYYYY